MNNSLRLDYKPILLYTLVFFFSVLSRTIFSPLLLDIEADLGIGHATASSFFLYPEKAIGIPLKGPGNADFLYNTIDWLYGRGQLVSIRTKSLTQLPMRMNQLQFFLFSGISIIIIPLLVFIVGLSVWLRRRHL